MVPLPQQKPAKKGQVCFGRFYLGKQTCPHNWSRKSFGKYKGTGRRKLPVPAKGLYCLLERPVRRGDNAG